jgi:uncharacterized membrane protein
METPMFETPSTSLSGHDSVFLETLRWRCRFGLSFFYLLAGILHIAWPSPFLSITPAWVPDAWLVIVLTGFCELAGGVGFWVSGMRRYAAVGLAAYAVCVFPANIKHAIDTLHATSVTPWQWAYHLVRLPLQPVIVWLALFAGEVVTWPFHWRKATPVVPAHASAGGPAHTSSKKDKTHI